MIRKYINHLIDKQFIEFVWNKYYLVSLLFLIISYNSYCQSHKGIISGSIKDSSGTPIELASVTLKGTSKSVTTDNTGTFILKDVPEGINIIVIQMIGYNKIEKTVSIKGGENTTYVSVTLTDNAQISEIVINGDHATYSDKESDYAAKISLKNMENAQVYSTVTKELLKDQLVFSVDDGLKNVPGLQKMWDATGRSGDGGAYYNARGFVVQSQLRNGIAGNVTSRIDAANLEKVEVIKGPSATLFGSTLTSYGGLINRVTKKPYDRFGGEITYSAGSYGFSRISGDINTPLDSAKKILLRINTAYNYQNSFQDNGFQKSFVFAPSLSYQVNNKLSFALDAEIYNGSNTSNQMIFFYFPVSQLGASRANQLGIDYNRSYSANNLYQVSTNDNYFGRMNYKISKKWILQTNVTRTNSSSDGPGAYFYLVPNSLVTGNVSATGSNYLVRADQSTANSKITVTEIQQNVIGDFTVGAIRNRFVAGLDFFSQNSNQLFYGSNFDTIPKNGNISNYTNFNKDNLNATLQKGFWTYPYRYKTNTYSAYVSDVVNITKNLIASAALRIDNFHNIGSYNQASGQYTGSYQQTAFSPKLGIVYQPVKDMVSLFANYQNGFTNKTGTDYAGKIFKPQQANQAEGGIKLDIFGGKISSTVSYYNISVTNMILPYAANPNFSIQNGTQFSRGIEVEVIANPLKGFNAIAGFAYNDSKMKKADSDVEGRRPVTAMSPYAANFWLSYKLTTGNIKGLGFGLGGNYASDNKVVNSASMGVFILPAYAVFNATTFYEHPKFRLALAVNNATNEHYWIGYQTMNPQQLRSITGSMTFKF